MPEVLAYPVEIAGPCDAVVDMGPEGTAEGGCKG